MNKPLAILKFDRISLEKLPVWFKFSQIILIFNSYKISKNLKGSSIPPVWMIFLLLELLFSYWIIVFKGRFLTCQVRPSKTEWFCTLQSRFFIWYVWNFTKLNLNDVVSSGFELWNLDCYQVQCNELNLFSTKKYS